jgi:hypothetical protein
MGLTSSSQLNLITHAPLTHMIIHHSIAIVSYSFNSTLAINSYYSSINSTAMVMN